MCKKIISAGEPLKVFDGDNLSTFTRPNGIPAPSHVVAYNYFMWLMEQVGLNGPNPKQYYRLPETEDKTYFVLATKLYNTNYKVIANRDDNRVVDGRRLRDVFSLVCSSYTEYKVLDKEGANMLEVLVALVQRFDTETMMTEEEIDRSKEWFWLMMRNAQLDIFVDSGFTVPDNKANEQCDAIIDIINNRRYEPDGKGGFFPLKNTQYDQRRREIWLQMHEYFLENMIE